MIVLLDEGIFFLVMHESRKKTCAKDTPPDYCLIIETFMMSNIISKGIF